MLSQTITFTWIPGTLTQVAVWHRQVRKVLHIDRVASLFGRPAMNGLYLSGHYSHEATSGASFEAL